MISGASLKSSRGFCWVLSSVEVCVGGECCGVLGGCEVSVQTLMLPLFCIILKSPKFESLENSYLSIAERKFDFITSSSNISERVCHNFDATFLTWRSVQ